MKNKLILSILFLLGFVSIYAQAPLNFSARLNITNVSGSDPYTLVGVIQDDLGLWSAADLNTSQDSVYHLEGSDLLIYKITTISSAVGNNFTIIVDDVMNSGILPSTGTEWAAMRVTTNYHFPVEIGNLATNFKASIDNRFKQRLDAQIASIGGATQQIAAAVGTGSVASNYIPYGLPLDSAFWLSLDRGGFNLKETSSLPLQSDNGLNVHNSWTFVETDLDTLQFNSAAYNKARLNFEDVDVYVAIPSNFNSNYNSEPFVLEFKNNSNIDSHYVSFDTTFFKLFSYGEYFAPMPRILISGGGTLRRVVFYQEYWAEGARWVCDASSGTVTGVTDLVNGLDLSVVNNKIQVAPDINELTSATVASGDLIAIADINDSNNPKKVTAGDIAALAPAPSYPVTGVDDQVNGLDPSMFGTLVRVGRDIPELTAVTVASGDLMEIADVSDSNNPKKVTAGEIASTGEYAAKLNQATDAGGVYAITHPFGATAIKYANLVITETVAPYVVTVYSTPSGTVNFQVWNPVTGFPYALPNHDIYVLIKI